MFSSTTPSTLHQDQLGKKKKKAKEKAGIVELTGDRIPNKGASERERKKKGGEEQQAHFIAHTRFRFGHVSSQPSLLLLLCQSPY